MTANPNGKIENKEELAKRWKDLVEKFDQELRDKGLSDEQREQLLKEILDGDDA